MWTEITKEGKAKFIERYTNPLTGKTHRVSVTLPKDTAKYRKEAQEIISEKIHKALSPIETRKHTVSELKDLYILDQSKSMKQSTWRRNSRVLDSVFDIIGHDTLVDQLTSGYVKSRFVNSNKSTTTLNQYLMRFKAFIHWCYDNDYLDSTTCIDKLKKFKEKESRKQKLADKYLEKEELNLLLEGMQVPRWAAITKVMALSGMRIGELIALNKSDVNYSEHRILINKTYDPENHIVSLGAKTDSSNRSLYMQPELEAAMRELKVAQFEFLLSKGFRHNTTLFLSSENGGYLSYDAYNKYLRENAEHILGRKNISTHVLRHTHVALLAENDVPLEDISARLGHADSKITKEVYYHVTKRLEEKRNQRLKQLAIL